MKQAICVLSSILFIYQIRVIQSLGVRRLLSSDREKIVEENQRCVDSSRQTFVYYLDASSISCAFNSLDQITFEPGTNSIGLTDNLNIFANIENERINLPKQLKLLSLRNTNLDWKQLTALGLNSATPELGWLDIGSNPGLVCDQIVGSNPSIGFQQLSLLFPSKLNMLRIDFKIWKCLLDTHGSGRFRLIKVFPKTRLFEIKIESGEEIVEDERIAMSSKMSGMWPGSVCVFVDN